MYFCFSYDFQDKGLYFCNRFAFKVEKEIASYEVQCLD